jgi:uncharacterized protein YprB with RNaseH-like and TPR domain
LAQLDRLTRRPEGPADRPGEGVDRPDSVEDTLVSLGLTMSEGSSGPLWTATHSDPLRPLENPLPDMHEIFSRGGEVRPEVERILFLDTETTGLAGGTGTIPFLVGASWWKDRFFETRQYFLPDPSHETAMLTDLANLASRFEVLVTFNGASFDLPLLRTRSRLNRLDDPLAELVGWDLRVPGRRLWGHRLENCRQQTLEREVCGRQRLEGDIEGSRIPQVWFDFLSDGAPGLLPNVLTHNHRDMVGMGHLFLKVVEAAARIDGHSTTSPEMSWDEAWVLGRICERRRDTAGSLDLLAVAAHEAPCLAISDQRFLSDAVRILKRGGDWKVVESLLEAGLSEGLNEPWIHREAAILYEHRLVDLARALDHALESGEDYRVQRLEKLLGRVDSGA